MVVETVNEEDEDDSEERGKIYTRIKRWHADNHKYRKTLLISV